MKELIIRGLLQTPESGRHLILEFEQLELRALAAWCEYSFGNSTMATAYRNGDDPVGQLAGQLTMNRRTEDSQRIRVAQILLTAIAQRIGKSSFMRMVETEFNLGLDSSTAASWQQTAFELFPELRGYQDDVAERLATNLNVSRPTIETQLRPCSDFSSISAQILGRNRCGPAFGKLCDLIQDTELRVRALSGGNIALYQRLLGRSFRLPTGRIRGKCVFALGNAEYLDLADDAMKAAIYEITIHGGEILAVADRTMLVLTDMEFDERLAIKLASDAAGSILNLSVEISTATMAD